MKQARFLSLRSTAAGCALALAALAVSAPVQAQDATRKELATRIVNLQKAHDMDALIAQLASSATQTVVSTWLPKLDQVPQARQKAAADLLDAELKKFNDDNVRTIKARNERVSLDVLVPAYAERFTADELRQLVAFMESPVIKKYYAANPQLANMLAQKLVDATRADVEARIKAFDTRAAQIIGNASKK
ncbi:DUF2059 domain-containing protein [Brachymonas denitrificans]|jgi:hypothetical protein|uniref:DUF2059 domain-containing protein n=1 Tax=Brachymonas denitrificans TaxID=28220 RepID=UPI001BCDE59C|nr:DUF2059 domain-containing protein [Brachymonas denitrificans]